MNTRDRDLLLLWKRKQFAKFNEALSDTEQLAQALDRNDQVSVQMWLSMRADPIQQAQEIQAVIENHLLQMPEDDAIRANELLSGAAAADSQESVLTTQVAQNQRVLERIQELDRRISLRLGGQKSFYRKFEKLSGTVKK